jgi:hypothetical protein
MIRLPTRLAGELFIRHRSPEAHPGCNEQGMLETWPSSVVQSGHGSPPVILKLYNRYLTTELVSDLQ